MCTERQVVSSITYSSYENDRSDVIRNTFHIRPHPERMIFQQEEYLCSIYALFSDIGGLVGVYTGLSVAAVVRVIALAGGVW